MADFAPRELPNPASIKVSTEMLQRYTGVYGMAPGTNHDHYLRRLTSRGGLLFVESAVEISNGIEDRFGVGVAQSFAGKM